MGRKALAAWVSVMALAAVPGAVTADAGGLTAPACVPLGVLLALTVTPVESLVATLTQYLPTTNTE